MSQLERLAEQTVSARLRSFPAVALVGPRQSGKTTLAKKLGSHYFDLEQESDRLRLDLQWETLTTADSLLVLDEAQTWPALFPRLRGTIDARRKVNGRFLLLGSVSPDLMREVSESLAGRIAMVELPPLSSAELTDDAQDLLWTCGGYPDGGVLDAGSSFPVWQESYLRQMAERDLPSWGLSAKPGQTARLMKLAAALNGGQVNASQLGQAINLSYHTIQSWLDYLEGGYLIRRLPPFFTANFPKRLVKTPKLCWRDSGLLHALLGLKKGADLFDSPWVGESWEGWVINQILNVRQSLGESLNAFYFRTSDGLECDLLIESGSGRELIEIKLTSEPSIADFRKLEKIAELTGATRMVLLSRVPDAGTFLSDTRWMVNLATYLRQFIPRTWKAGAVQERESTADRLYPLLRHAAGALVERGFISDARIRQRAQHLAEDLDALALRDLRILPPSWLEDPRTGIRLPVAEYQFGTTDFNINEAAPGAPSWNVTHAEGTGLNIESLLHLSRVCEIARSTIPDIWRKVLSRRGGSAEGLPGTLRTKSLADGLRDSRQHLNTLNEIWWLGQFHGIDPDSVEPAWPMREGSDIDWRFSVMNKALSINLEVKNRTKTLGSALFGRQAEPFASGEKQAEWKKFLPAGEHEINVLAVTVWYGDSVSAEAERHLVENWLRSLPEPVIDAVIVYTVWGSRDQSIRLYFQPGAPRQLRHIFLEQALNTELDAEDASRAGRVAHPVSWKEALKGTGLQPPFE